MALKLASWNVNGIRAVSKKGFFDWLSVSGADIVGLQETKIQEDKLTKELLEPKGFKSYWSCAERRGYSGVALYTRHEPLSVENKLGVEGYDNEGRTIIADYGDFVLFNIYFPNGKASPERLKFKLEFYEAFLEKAEAYRRAGRSVIVCGDFNTAHQEIDLARPKDNHKVSGFLPEERAWLDHFVGSGYVDTFRRFNNEGGNYTWWHMRTFARERNVGWRIDYFFTDEKLFEKVEDAGIESTVLGSDHCPVTLSLTV